MQMPGQEGLFPLLGGSGPGAADGAGTGVFQRLLDRGLDVLTTTTRLSEGGCRRVPGNPGCVLLKHEC